MTAWVLRNAVVVNEGRTFEADVAIVEDRIERIGGSISVPGCAGTSTSTVRGCCRG